MRPLVTLTTDFGMRDPYVAALKGQILSRCPSAEIIDLTHEIAPGNIVEGALFLAGSIPYFPRKTYHLVVIDPGVGSDRHPIVAALGGQIVVCPDNGLLTLVCQRSPLEEAFIITNPEFMRKEVSATFHGRDIFAPATGSLAAGRRPNEVGDSLDTILMVRLPVPDCKPEGTARGEIIHVDRFGNCITNIHRSILSDTQGVLVKMDKIELPGLSRTYGDVPLDQPLAIIGSSDYLEISVNRGSAEEYLDIQRGDTVEVCWQ